MFKRFFAAIAVAIIIANQLTNVALAKPVNLSDYDQKFYAGNNILFYDSRCTSGVAEGFLSVSGKDNLETALKFLMQKGLTLAQASGVIGNLMAESGLNPAIIQGGGNAPSDYSLVSGVGFGIAQWTSGGRQQNLESYAKQQGVPVTDLNLQLNFLWKEFSESYGSTLSSLKATDDPVQAAVVFHNGFEGSADSVTQVVTNRGGNASRVYQTYSDAPSLLGNAATLGISDTNGDNPTPASQMSDTTDTSSNVSSSTVDGSCADSSFSGGGTLSQTVVAYAWPQYAVRTDQLPAYSDAVTKATASHLYTGGNGGNDCGGFVTLLIRNSGFDTHYNADGKGGNTIAQEAWLKQNWQQLTPQQVADANKQPGDVAVNSDHTYIYVGQVGNFGSKIASASLGGPERAPMAGRESATDSSFDWYRIKAPAGGLAAASGTGSGGVAVQQTATGGGGGSF